MPSANASAADGPAAIAPREAAASICPDCGTGLIGPYCHQCGNRGAHDRRLRRLIGSYLRGALHVDGRLTGTLRMLATDPGRLGREWRDGRHKSRVSPVALFLASMFVLFLMPSVTGRPLFSPDFLAPIAPNIAVTGLTPAAFGARLEGWAYSAAFLLVPLSAAVLWLLTARRKDLLPYDHVVVSLYGLSFAALAFSIGWALSGIVPAIILPLVGAAALHAVAHLRGAYGLGWMGAIIRAAALAILSYGAFLVFILIIAAATTIAGRAAAS